MNLQCQRKKFDIVIGADRVSDFYTKIKDLVQYGFSYYAILHDRDVNADGIPVNIHYHLIITNDKKVRGSQVLKILVNILGCSVENIQIQQCINFIASLKYLIHMNDSDKFQYDADLIHSNSAKSYIHNILETQSYDYELTTESLFEVIEKCGGDIVYIIKTIGISSYAYYRNTINDILKVIRYDK